MAVVHLKCPHCLAMAQFRIIGYSPFPIDPQAPGKLTVSLGTCCPGCYMPVAVLARSPSDIVPATRNSFLQKLQNIISTSDRLENHGLEHVDHWPKPLEPTVPDHVPDAVTKAFLQAERNFVVEGNEEAAGSMYRRSLEIGLSVAHPTVNGTLAQRIKALVKSGTLTKEIGEWADSIRLIGNDAAHADTVTRDDLKMARGFADAVLRYIFTLPEQVKMRAASRPPP
jgi:hypothetical protein